MRKTCSICREQLPETSDDSAQVCPSCETKVGAEASVKLADSATFADELASGSEESPCDSTEDFSLKARSTKPAAKNGSETARPDDRWFGRFKIGEILGRGSYGKVFRAFDSLLDREVAIKVPRFSDDDDADRHERFLREAKAAARLRHPNIVTVYESGRVDNVSYIATEFVDGTPLSRVLRKAKLDVTTAVDWTRQIAEALDYAHSEGIVHRDIKPSNIMVNSAGRPEVMDFGLAKRNVDEASKMTMEGQVLGTPRYMAPEQARGETHNVGPLSDQYSVGVVLYEMLCGETPFKGDAWSVMSRVGNVNDAPPSPRTVREDIPRDLEACCLKALDKEPKNRYARLADFAEDLERWLEGRPLHARPIGPLERCTRWCARNRLIAGLYGIVITLVITAAIVGNFFAFKYQNLADAAQQNFGKATNQAKAAIKARQRESEARRSESHAKLELERTVIDAFTESGLAAAAERDPRQALLWFANAAALSEHYPERQRLNRIRFHSWLREVAVPVHAYRAAGNGTKRLRYHASGRYLMTEIGNQVEIRDLRDGGIVPLPGNRSIRRAAWSPDGRYLAFGNDQDVAVYDFTAVDDLATETALVEWSTADAVVTLEFSPDSSHLAVVSNSAVRVRDVRDTRIVTELEHDGSVESVEFSPLGQKLVIRKAGNLHVFPVSGEDGSSETILPPIDARREWLPVFVSDNNVVAVDNNQDIVCWDVSTSQPIWKHESDGRVFSLVTSPDRQLVVMCGKRSASVLDAETGEPIGPHIPHRNMVFDAAFHPDGRSLLTASIDRTARITSIPSLQPQVAVVPHAEFLSACAWSPDGTTFATLQFSEPVVQVWKLPNARPRDYHVSIGAAQSFVKLSPNRRLMIPTGFNNRRQLRGVQVYDVATGDLIGPFLPTDGLLNDAAFIPESSLIVTASSAGSTDDSGSVSDPALEAPGIVQFWNQDSGEPFRAAIPTPSQPIAVEADPHGNVIVVLCFLGQLQLIEPQTGKVLLQDAAYTGKILKKYMIRDHIRFSPSGDRFAIWGAGAAVQVRDTETGRLLFDLRHASGGLVHDVRFSPAGDVIATCSSDKSVRTWDSQNGESAGPELPHPGWVLTAQFNHDGTRILTACQERHARVWDWRAGTVESTTIEQSDEIYGVTFLGDRGLFVTGSKDGVINVWETETSKQLAPSRSVRHVVYQQILYQLALSGDRKQLVAAGHLHGCYGVCVDDWIVEPESQLALANLVLLGEILSGQRIDETGVATNLTQFEWTERWDRFQSQRSGWPLLDLDAVDEMQPRRIQGQMLQTGSGERHSPARI